MANATVEKLKVLGMRHGEKAAVAIVGAICLLCFALGFSKKTIELTPDQLKKSADSAQQNIDRPQRQEDIQRKLDDEKLVNPGFEKLVVDRKPGTISDAKYVFSGPSWVSPEPGAGLIRDMPELIAPYELVANANRGAVLVFDRDKDGNLIYVEEDEKAKRIGPRRRPRRAAGGMMGGGMMGAFSSGKSRRRKSTGAEEDRRAALETEKENIRKMLELGMTEDQARREAEKDKKEDEKPKGKPKEVIEGYRCVAIIGKLDHQKLKSNYVRALKDPNAAPHYLRLELQRQELDENDTWTKWEDVDRKVNDLLFSSIPEQEKELTPEEVRLEGLVDPLPFLKAGYWRGVHVLDMVPAKERKLAEAPKKKAGAGGAGGYNPMMAGASGVAKMREMMAGQSQMYAEAMESQQGASMGAMMAGRGGAADGNFDRSDAEKIMIRALDFTVDADATYRYRVRIVVRNPNLGWESVSPGVDVKTKELTGPWSEPTDPVSMPDDVTTYAMGLSAAARGAAKKNEPEMSFQVARWDADDGVVVVRNFDAGPGQIIGEQQSAPVPSEDTKKVTSKPIDFNSHQILLDVDAAERSVEAINRRSKFEAPTQGIVLRSDGALILRDEAFDHHNPETRQMALIYKTAMDEARAGGRKKDTGTMGAP